MAKTKADDRGRQKTERKFYEREELRRKRKAVQAGLGLSDREVKQRGKHIANGRP